MSPQPYVYQAGEENVEFEDTRETQIYTFPASSPDLSADKSPELLGDFLRRPALIATLSWLPAGVSDSNIDPWSLFFAIPEVKKKLDNFAYFRGNMHVKVVVNASPFYYGAMLINYTPTNTYVQAINNSYSTALIPQSQKPHIWIDLRENMGGEMTLPFIYQYNFVKITNSTAVTDLGKLRNITYAGLRSANGATVAGVTVKFYAWLEDVELCGNTLQLAMQAKKGYTDEYGNGPISRPATALAHWASYLTTVPVIAPYAKATQIGASAVSSVAGLFGWSKVPVIENVKPYKPVFFHDLASAHISEPMNKMTLDPKAEISVDPRIVGPHAGEDDMSISKIVQRDSYYFSSQWATTDAPDTLIGSVNVSPWLMDIGTATNTVYTVGYTPMAYVGSLFDSWRGDIIFTIKVVCSQYHRGRMRVHWDPEGGGSSSDVSNLVLTKIIDIGESTEIEFRVPFANFNSWLYMPKTPVTSYSTTATTGYQSGFHNGTLSFRVLNKLSAPIDSSTVSVFVFVRGAENLEFANPRPTNNFVQPYVVQNLVEDVKEDEQQKSSPLESRYLMHWGEAIPSLRLLLQRSCLSATIPFNNLQGMDDTKSMQCITIRQTRFPTAPGYDTYSHTTAAGVVVPGTQFKFAFTQHTPLTWLSPMFVAKRGSVQWHFHIDDPDKIIRRYTLLRSRTAIPASDPLLHGLMSTCVTGESTTISNSMFNTLKHTSDGNTGAIVTDNLVSPSISVEMPMMTIQRYQITNPLYQTCGISLDGSELDTYTHTMFVKPNKTSLAKTSMAKYCNAGTDFSLYMFLCAPQMFYCLNSGQTVT